MKTTYTTKQAIEVAEKEDGQMKEVSIKFKPSNKDE